MFSNLFDSHSDLSVFPTDINIIYAYFPVYIEGDFSRAEREKRLHKVVFVDLHNTEQVHDHFDIERCREVFFKGIEGKPLDDLAVVMHELLAAFRKVAEENVGKKKWSVVKETSLEMYATEFHSRFPGAKFIQLMRDPRDNYAALKAGVDRYKTFGDDERSLLNSVLHRALLGMKLAAKNQRLLGAENYKIVRFEDVVQRPRETMQDICNWLGVGFEDTMLIPTVLGRATRGNSYDDLAFFEVSAHNVGRWRERISPEEARILEFHFGGLMEEFGYEPVFDESEGFDEVGNFYKWVNYKYFYFDRFSASD